MIFHLTLPSKDFRPSLRFFRSLNLEITYKIKISFKCNKNLFDYIIFLI